MKTALALAAFLLLLPAAAHGRSSAVDSGAATVAAGTAARTGASVVLRTAAAPVRPPRFTAGELAVAVRQVGLDVAAALEDWLASLGGRPVDPASTARRTFAPAGSFDRGPNVYAIELTVAVPVVSF